MTTAENIWYKDPRGFVTSDNFTDVIPSGNMTYAQQLNAVMRLTLYYSAAISVIRLRTDSLVLPVAAAILTFLLYEGSGGADASSSPSSSPAGADGFYGGSPVDFPARSSTGAAANALAGAGACARPTRHNPFMNQLPLDPVRAPHESPACDPLVPAVKAQMHEKFQRDLFRDTGDLFERGNSERQFYTVPSNQPEDQTAFAQWIYGDVRRGGKTSRPPPGAGSSKRECDFGDY